MKKLTARQQEKLDVSLFCLLSHGNLDLLPEIERVLYRGANPNSPRRSQDYTIFQSAISRSNDDKILDVLVKYGADIDAAAPIPTNDPAYEDHESNFYGIMKEVRAYKLRKQLAA